MLSARRGASLPELLVAMVLLGIIGGATAGTLVQQGRVRTRIAWRLASEAQMHEAMAPLITDLGAASPIANDLDPGQATDTSIAIRITAAEGFVCARDVADSMTARVVVLSPVRGRSIMAGDSAWSYRDGRWLGASLQRVHADAAALPCGVAAAAGESALRLTLGAASAPQVGEPIRFTRRVRYSLYRAGDGATYLGMREWSHALGAYSGQQPVAGPLSRAGSRFYYVDSLGNPMTPSATTVGQLAQVGVELRAPVFPWKFASFPDPDLGSRASLRNRR